MMRMCNPWLSKANAPLFSSAVWGFKLTEGHDTIRLASYGTSTRISFLYMHEVMKKDEYLLKQMAGYVQLHESSRQWGTVTRDA
jgi:hypothetical protein